MDIENEQNNDNVVSNKISISEIFSLAWGETVKNLGFLLGFTFIFFVLYIVILFLLSYSHTFNILIFIILIILEVLFGYLLLVATVKISNGEKLSLIQYLQDMPNNFKNLWQYILGGIVVGVILLIAYIIFFLVILFLIGENFMVSYSSHTSPNIAFLVIGVILFIIIAVIVIDFSLRVFLYPFFIVDKNLDAISAIKKSLAVTKKHVTKILLIAILLVVINLVGELIFFIGLIFTIPFSEMVAVYIYKKLESINS